MGFHALRHTIVSQLACKGVPLEVIRGLVGHGGESMTRAYVHQSAEAARGAIGSLAALGPVPPEQKHQGVSDEALAVLDRTLDDMNLKQLKALAKRLVPIMSKAAAVPRVKTGKKKAAAVGSSGRK